MGFLEDLVSRAADLFGSPIFTEAEPVEEFAVGHDYFDADTWEKVRGEVPHLQTNIIDLHRKNDHVPHFFQDLFNLLYKGDPKIHDAGAMNARYRPNRALAAQFHALPELEGLRLCTTHDEYATAMAMLSMQTKLTQAYERMKAAQDAAEKAAKARQTAQEAAQAAREMLANAQDAAQDGPEELGLSALQAVQALEDDLDHLQGLEEQAQLQAEAGAAAVKGAMRSAVSKAGEERAAEDELMAAYGVADGELKRMSFEERRQLAELLRNNRLSAFVKLIGAFRALGDGERRRKVQHRPDYVVGVELGSDLMRITAGEMTNLAVPELEMMFWLRWASGELLQFKLEGTEKLGQGPIVVVCDESGSMQGSCFGGIDLKGGTPEAWSKALALALLDQARRGKRDFIYIGFSSKNQQWVSEFPAGVAPIAQVIEFTEHFFDGGTHYERPLEMARDIADRYGKAGKPRPDIVFITDDKSGRLDPAFLARWQKVKAATSMRVFGIAVGDGVGGNNALQAVSDNVRVITELTSDPEVMADLFRTI